MKQYLISSNSLVFFKQFTNHIKSRKNMFDWEVFDNINTLWCLSMYISDIFVIASLTKTQILSID